MTTAKQKFQLAYRNVRIAGRGASFRGNAAIGRPFVGYVLADGELIESCDCEDTPDGGRDFKGFVFSESFLSAVARGGYRQAALQAFAARLWAQENQSTLAERFAAQYYEWNDAGAYDYN